MAKKSITKKALPAIVWQEDKWFIAKTLNLELASQGRSKEEALENLQEALDLLLEDEGIRLPPSITPKNLELKHIYA